MAQALTLFTDGGARGNPGPAAAGMVVTTTSGQVLREGSKYLGKTTNNQAEYAGLIEGLKLAKKVAGAGAKDTKVLVKMDSELIVRQMTGEYRVRDADLKPRFDEAQKLIVGFGSVQFRHIPRHQNSQADRLVNEALDKNT